MDFKMTQEERLALRMKRNNGRVVLNKYGVRYTIRRLGLSPADVARKFLLTTSGSRELTKWLAVFFVRDLGIATPAIIVLLYTLFK